MENIEYGFVGKNNQRVYFWKDEEIDSDFDGGVFFAKS